MLHIRSIISNLNTRGQHIKHVCLLQTDQKVPDTDIFFRGGGFLYFKNDMFSY